ncbi:MAG: response regulator [Leptospirales bacterium]
MTIRTRSRFWATTWRPSVSTCTRLKSRAKPFNFTNGLCPTWFSWTSICLFPGGFIATQNIRQAAKKLNHKVVIIMYTASKDHESVQKAKSFGANDYLLKPVSRDGVKEKLGRHFPGFA